jgi:hypothetical protein
MAAAPDLLLPQPFEYESRPDAPNFSADYGFVPLQQSAARIEEAVAIAHTFPLLAAPPGPGARHLWDSGWNATPAAVAASKGRAISFGGR